MPAKTRYRSPPRMVARLRYPGTKPPPTDPSGPSLTDVMTAISQVQQNQAQILQAISGLWAGLVIVEQLIGNVAADIAPNSNAAQAVANDSLNADFAMLGVHGL